MADCSLHPANRPARVALEPGKTRVLVVDDNPDLAHSLTETLRAGGYEARAAYNGELALSVMAEFEPHCVVLDVHMPSMGGLELAQMLRTYFSDAICLVGMSGHDPAHPSVAAAFSLMDHRFSKPIEWAALVAVFPGLG